MPDNDPIDDDSASETLPPTVADLHRYFANETASFHMPGHKQRGGHHPLAASVLGEPALRNDVSEMGGFDYLHAPEGSIVEAQAASAAIFGATATHFLVNGSTVGNLAAVLSHSGDGDTVAALRGSHRSVYSAIALSGATPLYINMHFDDASEGWFVGTPPSSLPANTSVVHVTRPNYYGMACDLAPYVALARSVGAVLIVDEAHGTHFGTDDRLPPSALQCGADIVIQSTHKTLSALTQSSMLHIGTDPSGVVNRPALAQTLAMLQSSSPSVLLSLSLDLAAHEHARDDFAATRRTLDLAMNVRERLRASFGRCRIFEPADESIRTDPTKIVIDLARRGISGFFARSWLKDEYRISVELADQRRIVCSLTVGDDATTADVLVDALLALDRSEAIEPATRSSATSLVRPDIVLKPREAVQRRSQATDRAVSEGAICAEYVIPYPPGIPLLAPGERITEAALASLDDFVAGGARIVGPSDPTLETIQVVVA